MQVEPPTIKAPEAPKKPRKPRATGKSGGVTGKSKSSHADLTIGPPPTPEVSAESAPHGEAFSSEELIEAPHVDEAVVRTMLRSVGGVAHATAGRDDVKDHWQFTDREIDDLAPPLTRYINRRPKMRAAVARSDEASIALVLTGYTTRNFAAGRAAKKAEERKKKVEQQREADKSARDVARSPSDRSAGQNPYGVVSDGSVTTVRGAVDR